LTIICRWDILIAISVILFNKYIGGFMKSLFTKVFGGLIVIGAISGTVNAFISDKDITMTGKTAAGGLIGGTAGGFLAHDAAKKNGSNPLVIGAATSAGVVGGGVVGAMVPAGLNDLGKNFAKSSAKVKGGLSFSALALLVAGYESLTAKKQESDLK
jgi:hypothetical protein